MGVATDLAAAVEGLITAGAAADAELVAAALSGGESSKMSAYDKHRQLGVAIARRLKTGGFRLLADPDVIHASKIAAENMDAAGFETALTDLGVSDAA